MSETTIIPTPEQLGAVVKQIRKEQGLTQADLAKKAGTSRQFLIDVEGGHPRAEVGKVLSVMRALNLSPEVRQLSVTQPVTVRRDRKYFTSLALHQAVGVHLHSEPDRVIRSGLAGVEKRRAYTRGLATEMLDEWKSLFQARDIPAITDLLTREDEYAVEMRNLSPFLGVISEDERRGVLDRVIAEREWEH